MYSAPDKNRRRTFFGDRPVILIGLKSNVCDSHRVESEDTTINLRMVDQIPSRIWPDQ